MTSLRVALACTLALGLMGCGSNLCDRSTKVASAKGSDCGAMPVLGSGCSANLSSCSEADQKVLDGVLTCLEKLPVCQSIAKDAWKLQEDTCNAALQTLSSRCSETFFAGMPPGFDAGLPDAGPQPITDGGNGLSLVGVANQDTIALAWEPRRSATVDRWLLVESDALGDNRTEREFTPGTSINLLVPDAGMSGRRYFIVGLNDAGEVLTGTPFVDMTVDAGATCMGPNDCPDNRVCDLGQCKLQTCPFTMANTCPGGYQCFSPGECRRTTADGGVFTGGGRRDAGIQPLPFISNEITLTPRPPMVQPVVTVGSVGGKRPDVAAFDTARVALALEQEGQLIAHPSTVHGSDFADEANTSFGLDTVGSRVHLAWNPDSQVLYACYVVGRGIRVQKSVDRGHTWGLVVTTFEPPLPDDGGVGEIIRDCDIASWKNGGALMVTAENEALIVRELAADLSTTMKGPAFTSTSPDAGVTAVFAPSHPAIATLAAMDLVHITFTGTRLLVSGATDSEPYGVMRQGATAAFSTASRMTPSLSPSLVPEDWTAVAINPSNGRAVGAFTSMQQIATGTGVVQVSTVYISLFNAPTRTWSTGGHLNVFVTDQNTSVWLPAKAPTDVWFAFSPQLAPLAVTDPADAGVFAFSFVAGPNDGTSGDYRQYMVPFDLARASGLTTGKGWFVPPVMKMSDERVLDPHGSFGAPQMPVTSLTADGQISVYGVFIPGSGINADVEGAAKFFSWP